MSEDTFISKLHKMGLKAPLIQDICFLIEADIIGRYESSPIPQFTDVEVVGSFIEQCNTEACRNGLRKEQRLRLWEVNSQE